MAEVEKYGSTKRFGARYGRKLKERFGKIEKEQRKKQKCPYCSALNVKRVAIGIWNCRKCGAKFTGKAYSVKNKILREPEKEEKEEVGKDG
jgi:large subunit ribosomal protein L37Ae